jgi:hypothetical protein
MAAPASTPFISAQSSQLLGYGLLLGGAAVVGKLMIDGLVGDMDAAKARKEFIGPVWEPQADPKEVHVKLGDVVRFVATCVSVYSIIAELPTLVGQFTSVESTVQTLVTPSP